jgi:LPXTG-motif cell wall-anchored protein
MDTRKTAAFVLLALGALALIFGGFNYTRASHEADIGSLHLSVNETRHVPVPVWVGLAALALGGFLLVTRRRG